MAIKDFARGKAYVDFAPDRVAMQDAYMLKIDQEFGNRVRAALPLLETEVRGVDMLNRMVAWRRGETHHTPTISDTASFHTKDTASPPNF